MDIDDDDISLKGFVSEAVRRESLLPPSGTLQRPTSYSSLDSYGDEKFKDGPGYQADEDEEDEEDSSEEDDSTNNQLSVDDLLDEAMGDSDDNDTDVVMRTNTEDYDPDMDPDNVVLRRRPQTVR